MPTITARTIKDISAVAKAVREDRGLSQQELADRLAFSRDYLVDLESGNSNLYTSRLFRLLHELGVTVSLTYGDERAEP